MLFEKAVFALERAFRRRFVAEHEVMRFDFTWGPSEGSDGTEAGQKIVIVALGAETKPFSLSGFENEIIFERVFVGLIGGAPAAEKEFPVGNGFVREDEGF